MRKDFEKIVKFIRETFRKPEGFIPLHAPVFNGNEKKYLKSCIDSTYVSSVGEFVDKFEVEIANYTGAKQAVVCVNGTNALHLALQLVGTKNNTEVITQPLTFIATVNAISYCGAKPVFVDINSDTLGMSPSSLLNFLESQTEQKPDGCYNKTTNRKIVACVPMHTFGQPCRIEEIAGICKNFNIELVEDAAESMGSYFNGKHTGTFGKIGVLSFNGNKIITSGGGGMLLFNNLELANKAKHLTTQAKINHPWEFIHDEIGYNYRMPNINAALGLAQLEQINSFVAAKRELAAKYNAFFTSLNIHYLSEIPLSKSNYWLNTVFFKTENERNEFLEYSNNKNIMTRPAWQLMNKLLMFSNCQTFELENSVKIANRLVNLPSSVISKT